jgi:hypothetical protein
MALFHAASAVGVSVVMYVVMLCLLSATHHSPSAILMSNIPPTNTSVTIHGLTNGVQVSGSLYTRTHTALAAARVTSAVSVCLA